MKTCAVSLLCVFFSAALPADMSFYSIYTEYQRMMFLNGLAERPTLNYHSFSGSDLKNFLQVGPWEGQQIKKRIADTPVMHLDIFLPEIFVSFNTARNWGGNDRGLWQGKGFNTVISAGFETTGSFYALRFYPEIFGFQNSAFDIVTTPHSSGYGDYWTSFDNLQRYGDSPALDFSWGQSGIHVFYRNIGLGFSAENITLGPGQMNNILLGENAEGFPHFDFGTMSKQKLGKLGWGELKMMWGFLRESDFFDDDDSNDHAWISGMYAAFSPGFYPNFTLGLNHQYYKPLSDWDGLDLLRGIPFVDKSNDANDVKDMMASITFSFLFPSSGFEFYGEWARNDNFGSLEDLYKSPEHTQGYTLGVNCALKQWQDNLVYLTLEHTNLQQERTREVRAAGPWYRHAWAGWIQGYTHKGQLPGAAIGPGSNSQTARLCWMNEKGHSAITVSRIAHDKDYYYAMRSDPDINIFSEFNVSLEKLYGIARYQIFVNAVYALILNNNFIDRKYLSNVHFEFGFKYLF